MATRVATPPGSMAPGPRSPGALGGFRRSPATPRAQYLARGRSSVTAVYAASRRERSASPAEEYPGSRLAAVAPTLRSSGDPGVVTRLIPMSPRPFSLPEAATSTERQPMSMARQPRRSTATPVAPPVIAELSNSLHLLTAGASSSPSTSTSITPPAALDLTEAPPHESETVKPTNGGSHSALDSIRVAHQAVPLSLLSKRCRLAGRKREMKSALGRLKSAYSDCRGTSAGSIISLHPPPEREHASGAVRRPGASNGPPKWQQRQDVTC